MLLKAVSEVHKDEAHEYGGLLCPNYHNGSCQVSVDHDGSVYLLRPSDLDLLADHSLKVTAAIAARIAEGNHDEDDDDVCLTREEVDKLRGWLLENVQGNKEEEAVVTMDATEEEIMSSSLIVATTKLCPRPGCGNRESHFHGHACHHVREGCGKCKIEYCYRCLSTKDENAAERGSDSCCMCGGWSTYCLALHTTDDIERNLILKPYPYDRRCGCQVGINTPLSTITMHSVPRT